MTPTAPPDDDDRPRVVFAAGGTAGDLHPFLHLARVVQACGGRPSVIGPAAHADAARRAGVAYTGLGTEAQQEAVLADPALWDARRGLGVVWRAVEDAWDPLLAALLALPVARPTWLVVHPLAVPVAAVAVALRRGVLRLACAWLAPSNLRTVHDMPTFGPLPVPPWLPRTTRRWLWRQLDRRLLDATTLPGLNARRARHGLAPVAHFVDHLQTAPERSLALFPPWFAAPQPDWPSPLVQPGFPLYDPPTDTPLPVAVRRWLDAGERPLVVTAGTGQRHAAALFDAAIVAARRLDRPLVALTGHRAQLPAVLPPTVAWAASAPLEALLPAAGACVHHGGIGTTARALQAGVPQLVVPRAFDQFDNAARVRRLGTGLPLAAARVSPGVLAARLRRLLGDPDVARACAAVASAPHWRHDAARLPATVAAALDLPTAAAAPGAGTMMTADFAAVARRPEPPPEGRHDV